MLPTLHFFSKEKSLGGLAIFDFISLNYGSLISATGFSFAILRIGRREEAIAVKTLAIIMITTCLTSYKSKSIARFMMFLMYIFTKIQLTPETTEASMPLIKAIIKLSVINIKKMSFRPEPNARSTPMDCLFATILAEM